ncbi:suppressor of fused domain protein [Massilia sp. CCM 8733]|uniref:Suppressor of fused domain protein n=1 Tax=Massilia mucilaginosa TaxID=2609282 RepID=A0ABX0NUS9_9BURK|nr:suppressor of fused domain protein [Massilia mucilaginosa]NHZ90580.1 suppressor of fused domain protein [Massilia mucilaginosa]
MSDQADSDSDTGGWDAISTSLAQLYPGQQPRHAAPVRPAFLGGGDPLDGISVYHSTQGWPHWHYVTYGLSELYGKQSEDPDHSGYGLELTFRLRALPGETEAPSWAFDFLQNLARYIFRTGNVFEDGHWMTANGPIALDTPTSICSMAFAGDPQLPAIETVNGRVAFVQVVGLTLEEERAATRWAPRKLLDALLPHMPLWITDLERASLLDLPDVGAAVAAGMARDGSSTGHIFTDVLQVAELARGGGGASLQVTLGARQVADLLTLLPLRLPFGGSLALAGSDWQLVFEPADIDDALLEDQTLTVFMRPVTLAAFTSTLAPREGSYQVAGLAQLAWSVRKTLIRDASGAVVQTIG